MNKLWIAFACVMVFSFLVLDWIGTRIYQEMPPIPEQVVTTDSQTLIAANYIAAGQNVWQTLGGMEVGSVWGHGSYVAPTGRRTGCTGKQPSSSKTGPMPTSNRNSKI